MNALNMVSVPVDMREFRRAAALRNHTQDEGRALHHFLSEAFGMGVFKPFRLMVAPEGRVATLYAYTQTPEPILRENLECAGPDLLKVLRTDRLALRDMPENWREGRRLAFDLRVRPMRRLLKPLEGWSREESRRGLREQESRGAFRKGSEVDAFLVARLRNHPGGLPEAGRADATLSREAVYRSWLVERFASAAHVDEAKTRMVRFARTHTARHDHSGRETASEGPDAIFHGEMTVTDGVALARLLASGVGRHTAYGYGMLLLRPAER